MDSNVEPEERPQNTQHVTKETTSEEQPPLPEFNLKNVAADIKNGAIALFMDPWCNAIVIPLLVVFASVACKVVISLVPYTEIDFKTYMQQIQRINEGELDYSMITGDTGPIVYPAGFVQIYQLIADLSLDGEDIAVVQSIFGYLYTLTVLLSCSVYSMVGGIQPWALMLLVASKRLISIYVLRLFNDCFTTACMVGVTLILQAASYWNESMGSSMVFVLTLVAADLYSVAISIKMNALLYLPGFLIVAYFLCNENILKLATAVVVMAAVQIMVGWKFLLVMFHDDDASYLRETYLKTAFNFGRSFLYEWTVNWKFIPPVYFASKMFANLLLGAHILVLLWFIVTRFLHPNITGKSLLSLMRDAFYPKGTACPTNRYINHKTGPGLIFLTLASTNVIGVLFSRSLHYQFLSWYCWQLPFLLYSTGWGPIVGILVWGVHEWCWLVFPSTYASSATLVAILSSMLYAVWNRTENWF